MPITGVSFLFSTITCRMLKFIQNLLTGKRDKKIIVLTEENDELKLKLKKSQLAINKTNSFYKNKLREIKS